MTGSAARWQGYTLIELLVVMVIIALLLSIAAPRYFASVDRAKETTLRTDLRVMREAIDKYRADSGAYPADLQQLVRAHYLRSIPVDPETDSSGSWVPVAHPDGQTPGVYDVRSGSVGVAHDGSRYETW